MDKIHPHLQEQLWALPHKDTNNHPGKLSLCIGLPVMIKANEATECNVTNGAEAVVVGWQSSPLTEDKQKLEVVFVKLTAAPTPIQLEGLPENVVPITAHNMKIACVMPNDRTLSIYRNQVPLVPNFAMTDFNSQGRTRPFNVVDLQNCRNHQSIYTCLSRGSTYQGTIIVQGFDQSKFMGGVTGWLRQEFRELELLDEITKLKYEGKLPPKVQGATRVALIHSYQSYKGTKYVPKIVHGALN